MGQPDVASDPFSESPSDTCLTDLMVGTEPGYVKVPGYKGLSYIGRS